MAVFGMARLSSVPQWEICCQILMHIKCAPSMRLYGHAQKASIHSVDSVY